MQSKESGFPSPERVHDAAPRAVEKEAEPGEKLIAQLLMALHDSDRPRIHPEQLRISIERLPAEIRADIDMDELYVAKYEGYANLARQDMRSLEEKLNTNPEDGKNIQEKISDARNRLVEAENEARDRRKEMLKKFDSRTR